MKTKNIIIFLMSLAFVFSLAGCGSSDTTKYNSYSDGMTEDYSGTGDYSTPYSFDYSWLNRNNSKNETGYLENNWISEGSYSEIKELEEVDDCRVYINGTNAYCAVKMNGSTLSESAKTKIKATIKKENANISNVYFSTDETTLNRFENMLQNGINTLDNDLKELFK